MAELDLTDSIALTGQLCDLESESGNEVRIADAIHRSLATYDHLEVIRDGDAIVARTTRGRSQRVIIAGHIDTVPVNENLPTRYEISQEETFVESTAADATHLWGRGTVDMKAGVAVQLVLAAELDKPRLDVTWIWYDNEEVSESLNGLGRLARNHPELLTGDFAILGEPTNAEIEGGCNGNLSFEARTFGRRAHSARSWMGHNAIHDAATLLRILSEFRPETVEVDGLEYREGLNAVGINGGVAGNVLPDECAVHINYRFAPNRSAAEAEAEMRTLFDGYSITVVDWADGARPGLTAPIAAGFLAAVGGCAKPKYGWTDVARFSALGIPAVNYGPGDALKAHSDDERVELAQIISCERGLRSWLAE